MNCPRCGNKNLDIPSENEQPTLRMACDFCDSYRDSNGQWWTSSGSKIKEETDNAK